MNTSIEAEPGAPLAPRVTRSRVRRVIGAVTVLAALIALSALAWVWRHPTAFPDVAPEVSTSSDDWRVHESIFVGMTSPAPSDGNVVTVTLHEAEPNVVVNTAEATVSFGICTLGPDGGGGIGSARASDVSELCLSWVPVEDRRMARGIAPSQQLLMEVTPREPGTVEIAGAAVTYSHGWQRGTQDIGEYLRLRVR